MSHPIARALPLSALLLLVTLGTLPALVGCPSAGGKSDAISGRIDVSIDQKVVPLSQAQITILPLTPIEGAKAQEAPELQSNLRGISITNPSGGFVMTNLASTSTFADYPLLRNWNYRIRIEAPGYYIYEGDFQYEKGTQYIEIKLEEKSLDVLDDGGVIQIPEGGMQFGATPKRGV